MIQLLKSKFLQHAIFSHSYNIIFKNRKTYFSFGANNFTKVNGLFFMRTKTPNTVKNNVVFKKYRSADNIICFIQTALVVSIAGSRYYVAKKINHQVQLVWCQVVKKATSADCRINAPVIRCL